jgi:ATP-binding cassette, subfamily B, bacterial MsbA
MSLATAKTVILPSELEAIKKIFSYIKGRWSLVIGFTLFNLLSVVFSMLSLVMLVPFLNLLFGKDDMLTANPGLHFTKDGLALYVKYILSNIIQSHNGNKMWALGFICVAVLTAIIVKNTFLFLSRYLLHPLRNGIVRKLRADVFYKMLHLPIGFFNNERKGDVMARMTNDVKEIEDSIISVMDLLFSVPFTILFYLIFMLSLSLKLSIILFTLIPMAGLLIGRLSKRLKKQSTDNSQRIGNLLSIIEETLSGLRIIKAFGAEKLQQLKYVRENNYLNKLNNSIALRRELASPLSETLGVLVLCLIIYTGGLLVVKYHEIDAGTFILFILVFTQLLDPLKKFSNIFYNIQKGSASFARIEAILHATDTITEPVNAQPIASFNTSIQLKDVSFKYADATILQQVNITILKGHTVAIVGASGSGKSTLVDLLPRFHDASGGQVLIDGIDIRQLCIKDLRALIGVVSQEPILFNESIHNNIALGQSNASSQQVQHAAQVAHAHHFIIQKPQGYDTNIGDRGSKLSGGEKQRLTIARALLKNPPILILDEATSSLDTQSEKIVQDTIAQLMENRTCIIIAHRLSTVMHANNIVVLNAGIIVEQGTHQQLMDKQGHYYNLVNLQQMK